MCIMNCLCMYVRIRRLTPEILLIYIIFPALCVVCLIPLYMHIYKHTYVVIYCVFTFVFGNINIIAKGSSSTASTTSSSVGVNVSSEHSQVKLFISYAWEESTNDFVLKLDKDLKSKGFQTFLDKHDILPGDNIQHEVAEGMVNANGIIIVYSERYPDSKWCDNELQMAQRSNIAIFPVRRIKGHYEKNVDLAIGGILWADFTDNNENEYQQSLEKLIKGIEKK